MSEFKNVTDVTCKKGLMSSRVEIILKRDVALPSELVNQIATAVEQLTLGRELILSSTCVEFHTGPSFVGSVPENLLEELQKANAKILALQGDVKAYKDEAKRLQKVVDEASDGINKLHHNSTRVKEARERFIKRRSGNGIF